MSNDAFMNMINREIANMRQREFDASSQWTLGQLIDALAAIEDKSKRVVFDFPGVVPDTFDSWRGIYAELALGWQADPWPAPVTVDTLLTMAREADGQTFQGYKGGDFIMCRNTPVWIDNYGEYNRYAIVGIRDEDKVTILTEHQPD